MAENRLLLYLFALPNTVHWGTSMVKAAKTLAFQLSYWQRNFLQPGTRKKVIKLVSACKYDTASASMIQHLQMNRHLQV